MSNIYFISDIHLDINNSEVTKRFLDFINKKKSDMKELYILGDLFEFWIDDKYDIEQNNIVIDTLHDITKKGTKNIAEINRINSYYAYSLPKSVYNFDDNSNEWWHWVTMIVPDNIDNSNSMMVIGSGSTQDFSWNNHGN